jgi:hypothetical protein
MEHGIWRLGIKFCYHPRFLYGTHQGLPDHTTFSPIESCATVPLRYTYRQNFSGKDVKIHITVKLCFSLKGCRYSTYICLDDSVQHPVGPAVPVPEPGPYWGAAARTGRVPGGGQVSLCRRSLARREQA